MKKEFRSVSEKIAYLKGMTEGMNTDDKIISLIVDILGDLAYEIEDMNDDLCDVAESVDDLEDSVSDIEDFLEDCECDEDCCKNKDSHDFDEIEYDDEDDDEYEELFGDDDEDQYEVTCPTCSNSIILSGDVIEEGSVNCPNCGALLEFDPFADDDDEEESGE